MARMPGWLADQALGTLTIGPAKVALHTGTPCKGKTFEHHAQLVQDEAAARWRCTTCGTEGSLQEVARRLWPLAEWAGLVRTATALTPVILLPSSSPPGRLGTVAGFDVYRVQGIDRPMVAIPGA